MASHSNAKYVLWLHLFLSVKHYNYHAMMHICLSEFHSFLNPGGGPLMGMTGHVEAVTRLRSL